MALFCYGYRIFFFDHTHQTKVGWSLSEIAHLGHLLSGVVQGSDIGSAMFFVYKNELIAILEKTQEFQTSSSRVSKLELELDDLEASSRINT